MQCVIRYPDGRFQGYPGKLRGSTIHPKVEPLARARIYPEERVAKPSIAHKGGEVILVSVALLEPAQ